ncbi:hypothetical protein TCAL_13323 [Tigriopus californicus]|uniref:Peptidase M13 C-terminal domain-containing protein n=3 Tax=Tigriopus californicus TaxID=6832 RepID=A0A553N8T0_TIGCA|nr:hypothetical protein TCAL_13323 [Tigriopus californicus]|eukprot:TCALIF_13323-PA protein Name:"Similar to ECE1 Endothelin-converting enzyme 1 (Cavia porcellus)" AED:0.03 eAED:0.03 QI:0/0/0/1/0/0/2/0/148
MLDEWWDPATTEGFDERASCFVEQYSQFRVESLNVSLKGKQIQGEVIADNGGLAHAYNAYVNWVEENGEEESLPGLNLSGRQLFWTAAANVWCSKTREQFQRQNIALGVHPPPKFRVNGPLQNSPEFAKDFNCPSGTPMNPSKKCKMW